MYNLADDPYEVHNLGNPTVKGYDLRRNVAAYAVDQVFADIWTRPGLDRRSRSLVSMPVMIAMRQPHEFVIHMGPFLPCLCAEASRAQKRSISTLLRQK
jgi:alkylhydroperoxidase/carboxymuconolactone decarboxylase family protein YurZ